MPVSDNEVRKRKLVVIFLGVILLALLLAAMPAQRAVWQVVMGLTPSPPATAVVQVPTATATATTVPTATSTPSPTPVPATATPTPVPATATATATPTPVPATATSTATPTPEPPTPTPTPTLDPSVVHPVPKGVLPVTDELDAPVITSPEEDLETTETEVTIEGTAPANARVVVYDSQFPLGMVVADDDGKWQYEPPEPWSEAEHVIVARTTDGDRLSQPSDPVRVVVVGERLPITGRGAVMGQSLHGWLVRIGVIALIAVAAVFVWRARD
jgi:hypothetical protein